MTNKIPKLSVNQGNIEESKPILEHEWMYGLLESHVWRCWMGVYRSPSNQIWWAPGVYISRSLLAPWTPVLEDFIRGSLVNRVLKCDVIKNQICEIMGFVGIFSKNIIQEAYLLKTSIVGQFVSEILAQLCSDDSLQILLNSDLGP